MKPLPFIALLALGTNATAQQIQVDLASGPPYVRHFSVETADGSSAKTLEAVKATNEALFAKGNTEAAWELGLAYMQGVGAQQDLVKAVSYFEKGATKPEEKSLVGEFYEHGEYFPKDRDAAAKWFLAAGRPGDIFELAQQYRMGDPPNFAKAAALYRSLLDMTGHPEVRRAQMELGNLVIDGRYSAGNDSKGRALNLEWARVITQELLGQEEYKIAIDFGIGREGVEKNLAMWQRYCKRAASYNIDLAQSFYGKALIDGTISPSRPLEGYAWIRLSSDKQYSNRAVVTQIESKMTPNVLESADSIFEGLVDTRMRDGAYYSAGDALREPSQAQLATMANDDPDVQLRRAFELEMNGSPEKYMAAMDLYRRVRDRRKVDVRLVLWHEAKDGTDGVTKDPAVATYYLNQAANEGSMVAKALLRGDKKGAEEERRNGDPIMPAGTSSSLSGLGQGVFHAGGAVRPPKLLKGKNPTYSKEARKAKSTVPSLFI